ncbi:MAG: Smr/MutS family protein [Acidisphaera sp.]|nr:Smr/MutS family protein [Acidisphaera sp.]
MTPPPAKPPDRGERDLAAWAEYLAQVKPLPGRSRPLMPFPPEPTGPVSPPATAGIRTTRRPAQSTPLVIGRQPPGVDNATWRRLRTGRLPPGRSLDLHGHSAQRAYQALEAMLRRASAERLRCVEVITGRGQREGSGVIRREFPLWLNLPTLRPLLLAAAHAHSGNPGATRLLLRRP